MALICRCMFYQDLFRYIPEKNEWRSYTSACTLLTQGKIQPGPRSAHQMVGSSAGGGQLWCFGGEFASTKQTNFHHYRDVRSISHVSFGCIRLRSECGKRSKPKYALVHAAAIAWSCGSTLSCCLVDLSIRA